MTNNKNGTITGALEAAGQVSEALAFDGTDDFIEVPYDVSFRPVTGVTLSTWFRVTSFTAGDKFLVGNLNAGGYGIALNNDTLSFRVNVDPTAGTPELAQISTTLVAGDLNTWKHVAAIYDNGTLRLFLDGTEILPTVAATSANKELAYPAGLNSLTIGAAAPVLTGNSGGFFAGRLDEVAFWGTALSDTVVQAIYDRGVDGDQVYYNVTPPQVPTNLNITYYNSLVSRANLTVSSCAGLDFIIVTKDEFPPDKNDINWQRCNTLVGGLLSKELSTADSFGKLWTKDNFGNVSRNFEYVPINTPYDKPISRPVVHWTFDNVHYTAGTRTAFDRLSQINLKSETLQNTLPYDGTTECRYTQGIDTSKSVLQVNQAGVLNQSFRFSLQPNDVTPGISGARPAILRANHPENIKTKPIDSLTVSAWVFLDKTALPTSDSDPEMQQYDRHIVSSFANNKGWALSHGAFNGGTTTVANRSFIFKVMTNNGLFRSYLEDSNLKNGWHLITGSFDGTSVSLFIDGIFVKSFATPPGSKIVYEAGANTFVGSQGSTTALPSRFQTRSITGSCFMSTTNVINSHSYFTNRIEEVLIWDKPLSKLEVSSLYHNGADVVYASDTTPPPKPYLVLENTRPDMFSNKAYFTLRNNPVPSLNDPCGAANAIPVGDGVSGVLVNEGTMPDKQDARWESCRSRRGSFGLENLTPGGHTITVWFKDLAGNVTPVSSDLVVNFIDGALPSANAVWPLDKSHAVSKYAVDVIDSRVHDLLMTNVDTPLNPLATYLAPGASVVKEGLNLASTSAVNGAFLSTPVTTLLTPVNYMSVGGWFYLTSGDAGTKVLVDTHRTVTGPTGRHGYKLFLSGGSLRFLTEFNIAGQQTVTYPMASIPTGWNHVLGVFTGQRLSLFVNGAEVGTPINLSERDFINYDDGTFGTGNATTDFRVGAESEATANPSSFHGAGVDELGLWGFDLTPGQVQSVFNAPATQSHFYDPLPAPANVENAFIYHYDNFGSRARMTILNCTNTPFILVQDQGAPVPSAVDDDWRECNTIPGAILSKKLSLAVGALPSYVDVYAKNADGLISSVAGRKEILPVIYDYDLVLPITYFSFNNNQRTTADNDFIIRNSATLSNNPTRVANSDGHEYLFNGLSTPAGSVQGINVGNRRIYDLREGISLAVWMDITNGDMSTRRIVSRDSIPDETALLLEGGALKFRINIPSLNGLIRSTVLVDASYATANISTGRHFVVGTYDGLFVRLYLDSMLVGETNVRYRNYDATAVNARIDMDSIQGFRLGSTGTGVASPNGAVDEFMVFDRVLTEAELVSWYKRYKFVLTPPDSVAPTGGRPLAVVPSTGGADVNERPVYTIGDCTDIAGVFVTLDPTPPSEFDAGWQYCQTHEGYITGPVLNPGANTVYFYYKDQFGNVTLAGDTVPVNYNPPARPNPVAYWNMDDNSVVGERIFEPRNFLHANMYGVLPANFTAGGVGRGIQLDGARKYLEVNHSPILKPTQELSVSFWMSVPVAVVDRSNRTVLGTRGSEEGYTFRWTCNLVGTGFDAANTACTTTPDNSPTNEFFEFVLRLDDGSDQVLDVPQSLIGTGPMHMVGTYDGRFMKLYRNGILLRTKDLRIDREIYYHPTRETSLVIGAKVGVNEKPTGEYFRGIVDEVAIFDKALTQSHVTDLNGFINTDTRMFDPARPLLLTVPNRARIYEPGLKTYGSRLRLTMSSCVDTDMILVSNSIVAPAANDENWQPCNTHQGGILSAPFPPGTGITPQVWAKTFDGRLATTPGGLENGETVNVGTYARVVPRPKVIWSLDSTFSQSSIAPFEVKDHLSMAHGSLDAVGAPTNTVLQLNGLFSISGGTDTATVNDPSAVLVTQVSIGDRVKIAGETLQISAIAGTATNPILTFESNHLYGATNATALRIGKINEATSTLEGGFDFNGINTFIAMRPTAATNSLYKLSISAWAELKKGETLHRHIVGNYQNVASPSGQGAGLKVQGGQLKFYVTTTGGTGYYEVGIDTNLYKTGLHHITGTYDGRDLVLYLDGVFVKKNSIPLFGAAGYELTNDDFSFWTIGAEAGVYTPGGSVLAAPSSYFNGVIDEINIWHTNLSEQEVYYVYEFGSSRLPTAISDGIPPTDPVPGIFITNGQTIQSSPWTQFTMPSCTGGNGTEINAVYVSTLATPPANDAIGWQFCTKDSGYIISDILTAGSSTPLYVYYRDEEGDVSPAGGATPPFNITYVPPELVHPLAYYDFEGSSLTSTLFYTVFDRAGSLNLRLPYSSLASPFTTGKKLNGFRKGFTTPSGQYISTITETTLGEYNVTKNFSVAFWYRPTEVLNYGGTLLNQGQYAITRTASDTILVTVYGSISKQTTNRISDVDWTHIAVSREGSSLRIYLNGKLDSSHLIPNIDFNQYNNTEMSFGNETGFYDELVLYPRALSTDQIAYVYYLGAKSEPIKLYTPHFVAAPVPNYYWNFNAAATDPDYLNSVTGNVPLRKVNLTAAPVAGRVQESYLFDRFEDVVRTGPAPVETGTNTVGPQEYLESDGPNPLVIGTDFTISTWVKQTVASGFSTTGDTDSTAVIDLWGADNFNKKFQLTYDRGQTTASSRRYRFNFRNNNADDFIETNSSFDQIGTGWTHLVARKKGRYVTLFVNGVESGSKLINNDFGLGEVRNTKLRLGNSSLYSFYQIPGTVSVAAGTAIVTGAGTQFLTDLFVPKQGTVTVAPGSTTVTGTGTDFLNELPSPAQQRISINGETHAIASVTNATELVLATPHVTGATDVSFRGRHVNAQVRIGLENRTILSIDSDTQLTLTTNHTAGATGQKLAFNINANATAPNDEFALDGELDDVAIWNSALDVKQISRIYTLGNTGNPVPVTPLAALVAINGSNTVNSTDASFQLSDCGGNTHIWIGLGGTPPAFPDPSWIACDPQAFYSSGTLAPDALNTVTIYFHNGTVQAPYTASFDVQQATGDTTAPVVPIGNMVLENSNPTTDAFARFTLFTCADGGSLLGGVFIGPTGATPTANQSGWQTCNTNTSGLRSHPLSSGANSISVWFKDMAGNVSSPLDYTLTYNPPAITNSIFSLPFDNAEVYNSGRFIREIRNAELGVGVTVANIQHDNPGQVGRAVSFTPTAYFDFAFTDVPLTNTLSVFGWVNLSTSSTGSHIIGRWDDTPANDSWAIRVDSTGRVCLDVQTTASAGVWNTNSYKRVCSASKINFARWQHIGVVRIGSSVTFFIENTSAGSDTIEGSAFKATTLSLRVGAQDRGGVAAPVNGLLDELHVWNTSITASQRGAIYASGLKGEVVFAAPAPINPVVLPDFYWRFEPGSLLSASYGPLNFAVNTGASSETNPIDAIVGAFFNFVQAESDLLSTNVPAAIDLAGDFTISTWVKPSASLASDILSKWNSTDVLEQEFRLSRTVGNLIVFHYQTTAPSVGSLTSFNSIANGVWTHLAVTRRGPALYLYINGIPQAVQNIGTNALVNATDMAFSLGGNPTATPTTYFSGGIDDVVIYKTYLNERRLKYNIDLGVSGTPVAP